MIISKSNKINHQCEEDEEQEEEQEVEEEEEEKCKWELCGLAVNFELTHFICYMCMHILWNIYLRWLRIHNT